MHFLNITWNPDGILFDLGFFQIRYYSLMFVIAFLLGWNIMKPIFKRENLSMEKLDKLFIYSVVAILVGARLGHVFFYDWDYFQNHIAEILLPIREDPNASLFGFIKGYRFTGFTGLASHGAAIGMIAAMFYYAKKVVQKPVLWVLDRVVIPVSLGGIFVRLGNFMNSEIVGKETSKSLFTSVRFIRNDITDWEAVKITGERNVDKAYELIEKNPKFTEALQSVPFRHPAQLYEAFGYIFVFALLYYLYWKTDKRNNIGFIFGVFLATLWTVRFIVEFGKKSQGGFESALGVFSTGQWLSIPFIIAGLYFIFRSLKKEA
ncbi:prolipoprotein diacylglyceryl transferase [Abyssalbus ytuae]|uniref:Phosphatidylglycerol--prolipoprotein diacylglyceryl transferase n=1 Tax=Abyssalbus ytuae TaxID=2926907 RepID=A0A9E7D0Z9_9FLAO|nr:prolipoprotein diacylglyceryl transferase [Abyssalbus ytuae]UOB16538.1 prolipoprotein diacylglyceryl transferase [Abyssalbus ytuae]